MQAKKKELWFEKRLQNIVSSVNASRITQKKKLNFVGYCVPVLGFGKILLPSTYYFKGVSIMAVMLVAQAKYCQ